MVFFCICVKTDCETEDFFGLGLSVGRLKTLQCTVGKYTGHFSVFTGRRIMKELIYCG